MSLEDNRRQYDYGKLTRDSLSTNPFEQFRLWMQQAIDEKVLDPTAMSVATVSAEGKPWQRMAPLSPSWICRSCRPVPALRSGSAAAAAVRARSDVRRAQ